MARAEYTWNDRRECWEKNVRRADGTYTKLRAYGRKALPELKQMIRDFEAQQAAHARITQRDTVANVTRKWLPIATTGVSYSWAYSIRSAVETHIVPIIGDIEVSRLKPDDIDRLMMSLDGKSSSIHRTVLGTMKRICRYAIENRYMLDDPTVNKTAKGARAKNIEPLTREQQAVLIDAVRGTRVYLFVLLGLYAGLRREEILGLAWDDVYLDGAYSYIRVTHAVHFEGETGVRTEVLKSNAARRQIPIPDILRNALEAAPRTSALVVPSASGTVCTQSAFRRLWGLVKNRMAPEIHDSRRYGKTRHASPLNKPIDFIVRPHILRHTYITELCAKSAETGLDIKTIQYLAGHADPSITLRIYAHVQHTLQDRTSEKIRMTFQHET